VTFRSRVITATVAAAAIAVLVVLGVLMRIAYGGRKTS